LHRAHVCDRPRLPLRLLRGVPRSLRARARPDPGGAVGPVHDLEVQRAVRELGREERLHGQAGELASRDAREVQRGVAVRDRQGGGGRRQRSEPLQRPRHRQDSQQHQGHRLRRGHELGQKERTLGRFRGRRRGCSARGHRRRGRPRGLRGRRARRRAERVPRVGQPLQGHLGRARYERRAQEALRVALRDRADAPRSGPRSDRGLLQPLQRHLGLLRPDEAHRAGPPLHKAIVHHRRAGQNEQDHLLPQRRQQVHERPPGLHGGLPPARVPAQAAPGQPRRRARLRVRPRPPLRHGDAPLAAPAHQLHVPGAAGAPRVVRGAGQGLPQLRGVPGPPHLLLRLPVRLRGPRRRQLRLVPVRAVPRLLHEGARRVPAPVLALEGPLPPRARVRVRRGLQPHVPLPRAGQPRLGQPAGPVPRRRQAPRPVRHGAGAGLAGLAVLLPQPRRGAAIRGRLRGVGRGRRRQHPAAPEARGSARRHVAAAQGAQPGARAVWQGARQVDQRAHAGRVEEHGGERDGGVTGPGPAGLLCAAHGGALPGGPRSRRGGRRRRRGRRRGGGRGEPAGPRPVQHLEGRDEAEGVALHGGAGVGADGVLRGRRRRRPGERHGTPAHRRRSRPGWRHGTTAHRRHGTTAHRGRGHAEHATHARWPQGFQEANVCRGRALVCGCAALPRACAAGRGPRLAR